MRSLKHTVEIHAPASVVWRVLTTRDLVREWAEAFREGIDIRCAWRKGASVEWKAGDGTVFLRGVVGAFEPERHLRFDYPLDPESRSPARDGAFHDAWTLAGDRRATALTFTTGPLAPGAYAEFGAPHRTAAETIKSLAEEAAAIQRSSNSPSPNR